MIEKTISDPEAFLAWWQSRAAVAGLDRQIVRAAIAAELVIHEKRAAVPGGLLFLTDKGKALHRSAIARLPVRKRR